MSYAQFGLIEATDFNALVGGNPTTTANTLNATWATGGGSAGYGQTAVANVAVGNTVIATGQWNALVSNTSSAATHQGSSITSVSAPTAGGTVTFLSAIPTNLSTIFSNRLNAATQGSTNANTATRTSTWSQILTFTHTATFANADAARYFFNAGGQLKMTCSHPSGTGIDLLMSDLASNVGTVALSSPASGSVTIGGLSYNGITKVGGGGNTPTIAPNNGYYGLSTSNTTVFTQTASTGPSGYLGTFIRYIVRTNGTQGSNSDNGTVITVHTIWDQIPDGLVVSANTATTMTVQAPETTNLANTWGAVSLTGTVSGS